VDCSEFGSVGEVGHLPVSDEADRQESER